MKIVWITLVWPESRSSAAGVRTTQLLHVLRDQGHEVQICSACSANAYQAELAEQGFKTVSYQPNDPNFDTYIRSFSPELVFFDRFLAEEQFGWRVREQVPSAIRILDTVDLHSLRRARQQKIFEHAPEQQWSQLIGPALSDHDWNTPDAIREIASIYRCDQTLVVSDVEIDLLQTHYQVPSELLSLCRIGYSAASNVIEFEDRLHLVAIGNFNHQPNADSYRVLSHGLWQQIRDKLIQHGIPNCELHIFGAYPTTEFTQLDNPSTGFRVKGWAEDVRETVGRYRVNLAPLRFGAGIKGKIADGWSVGTPCVATSIAAEGMTEGLPFGGMVADDLGQFAESVVELYLDQNRWEQARTDGFRLINELYAPAQVASAFVSMILAVSEKRDELRAKNFTGQMLWQHLHRSTEYFSRWIEAKNRRTPDPE